MNVNPLTNINFGWNIKTHEYITRKALEGTPYLSPQEINEIAKYSQEPDLIKEELVDMSSGHFYDALHVDPSFGTIDDERNNALSRCVNHSKKAEEAVVKKDREGFKKAIGYSVHYLQDGATPPHTEHGNYLHKLYRLPMHIQFERGKKLGASSRLDILEANYKPEEIPFTSLEMLFHNTALFTVQPENHVSYTNVRRWAEIQQRCVNRAINATKAYFEHILPKIPLPL